MIEGKVEFDKEGNLVLVSGLYRLVFHENDGTAYPPRIEIVAPNVAVSITLDTRQLGELALTIIGRLELIAQEAAQVPR